MRLQYVSDIHLERMKSFPRIESHGNILTLLGDIGSPMKQNYSDFLKYCAGNWDLTILLAGNHEYWSKYSMEEINDEIHSICNKFNNVVFLNNDKIQLDKYNILGTTLWSKTRERSELRGNDLIKINGKPIGSNGLNSLHDQALTFLKDNLNDNKENIVLSHFLPTFKLVIDKYKNYPNPDRFASDLDHMIKKPIKLWLCGHSHCNYNIMINDVFCGINAYPYNKNSTIAFET